VTAAVRSLLCALALLIVASASTAAQALTPRDVETFSDSLFKRYVNGSAAPSLAVIVVRANTVLFQKGYGLERVEPSQVVDPESTLFHVASVSKLFVATAAMQLVSSGRLRLNQPISELLPAGVSGSDARGVTTWHLLTHTSGLDAPFMRGIVPLAAQRISLEQYFARHPPKRGRQPGREIRYSNEGMSLAALVVEQASRQPFNDYVARHILAPLGMRHSTFDQPPPQPLQARVATAGSGRVPNALVLYPSGSMVSTAADMGRFMRAHLAAGKGEPSVLSSQAFAEMHRRQFGAHPNAPGVALGSFESNIGGVRGLFHTGARTHFSLMYLIPQRDVGIFIVHSMRQGGPFQSLRGDYVRAFVDRYFPDSSTPPLPPLGAAGRADRLAGVYRPILLSATTIERAAWLGADTRVTSHGDGSLSVAIPAGPTLRAWEVEPGRYVTLGGAGGGADLTIAFSDTIGAKATRMSLSGGTQDPVSFDRLGWYQRGRLHAVIMAAAFAIIISLCLVAAVGRVARLVRRRPRSDMRWGAGERTSWRFAIWASALTLAAPIAGVALAILGQSEAAAADGLRRALVVALSLLVVGCALALATIPAAVVAWRHRYWTAGRRIYVTVFACAAAVLVPMLAYYRLLDVRL